MEVHYESLGMGLQRDKEAMTLTDQIKHGHVGTEGVSSLDPSPAELAQCQAEMVNLLTSIAELNKKIGKLKAPSEPEDFKPSRQSRPLVPGLGGHRLLGGSHEKYTGPNPPIFNRESRRELWPKLQKALTAVENSINTRRKWALFITASDLVKQTEHLVAAEASTTQATKILGEMEREFGILCPPGLPTIKRPHNQDVQNLKNGNSFLQSCLGELDTPARSCPDTISQMEDMSSLRKKLEGLQKTWSSGNVATLYCPSGTSTGGPRSPDPASPTFPGSPLHHRRSVRAFTAPLSTVRDNSPPASPESARAIMYSLSPFPSPTASHVSETERLQRCIERLKARNRHLTAALEHRKGESQQVHPMPGGNQADGSALQMALAYCKECEEAYSELLSLYKVKKQQDIPICKAPTTSDPQLPASPSYCFRKPVVQELSTSFSAAGDPTRGDTQTPTGHSRSELAGREAALRQQIERLKRDRTAACVLKPDAEGPGFTGTLAKLREEFGNEDNLKTEDRKEKIAPLYELITAGEEMKKMLGETHLAEEELRCLDRGLPAHRAPDLAEPPPSGRHRSELHECKAQQQVLAGNVVDQAKNRHITFPQNKANLEELHNFQRKAGGSYRNSRRRYQEQVWRLEQKLAAMSESHQSQIVALKATVEALESRREETAL